MKKGDITWETIAKIIIILIVFVILLTMAFIFKDRLYKLFYAIKSSLGYRGP